MHFFIATAAALAFSVPIYVTGLPSSHRLATTVAKTAAANVSIPANINAKLDAFEAKYDALLRKRGVPGMFFGLATADKVIRTGGIGILDVNKPDIKVNGDTLFGIGSTTKSMTSALLSTAIAEGKVKSVSEPIRKYYPYFALKDPYASEHCSFEDAMSHRTGAAAFDVLEYVDRYGDPDGIAKRLKYLDPANEFRTTWQYNNLMWDIIGHAAVHIINSNSNSSSGGDSTKGKATYESAMQDRLFKPIGMNRTTTLTNVALKNGNLATPHIPVVNASAKAVEHDDIGVGGPSGSVYSSANDAIRYLQTLLRRGETPAGKRVLESSFVEDSIKPRMVVGAVAGGQKADNDKDFSITTYALGWDVENFRGRRLVSHSGGVVGFSTFFAWLPEYGVAVAASTNCEVDFTSEAAVLDLLDIFFGEDNRGKDWPSIFDSKFKPPPPQLPKPVPNTKPSHASLDEYTGVYAHPAFGSISITLGKASGVLVFEAFDKRISSELKHYHYDTFSCRISILPSSPFDLPITFHTDALTGKINQANIPLDPLAPEITFTRTK